MDYDMKIAIQIGGELCIAASLFGARGTIDRIEEVLGALKEGQTAWMLVTPEGRSSA